MKNRKTNNIIILLLSLLAISLVLNFHFILRAIDYRNGANEWLDKYTNVIEEYSQLSKYHNANATLRSDSIVSNRIVFYGTQVIARWNLPEYFPEYEAINRGIEAQWSSGLLLRFYQDVLTLMPKYVLIEISSYNLRPRFPLEMIQDHVISMAELAQANSIKPILTTMVPRWQKAETIENYSVDDSIRLYNHWIKSYCWDNDFILLDLNSILADSNGYLDRGLSFDTIDPNDEGYKRMSHELLKLLRND